MKHFGKLQRRKSVVIDGMYISAAGNEPSQHKYFVTARPYRSDCIVQWRKSAEGFHIHISFPPIRIDG